MATKELAFEGVGKAHIYLPGSRIKPALKDINPLELAGGVSDADLIHAERNWGAKRNNEGLPRICAAVDSMVLNLWDANWRLLINLIIHFGGQLNLLPGDTAQIRITYLPT